MSNDDDNDQIVTIEDLIDEEPNNDTRDGYGIHRQDDMRNEHGAVPIPKNFFRDELRDDVFDGRIAESKKKWEQFFWTRKTVQELADSIKYNFVQETCLLTTPSLAHHLHVEESRDEKFLILIVGFHICPALRTMI